MKVKSEFDEYNNLVTVDIGIGCYCIDMKRFVRKNTIDQQQARVDDMQERVDKLKDSGKSDEVLHVDNRLSKINAKIALYEIYPYHNRN